jgi:hypothetical protein
MSQRCPLNHDPLSSNTPVMCSGCDHGQHEYKPTRRRPFRNNKASLLGRIMNRVQLKPSSQDLITGDAHLSEMIKYIRGADLCFGPQGGRHQRGYSLSGAHQFVFR